MAPVDGDTLWRCMIVCLFSLVVLVLRTVCVYKYECEDLLSILDSMYGEYRKTFSWKTLFLCTFRPTSYTQHNTPRHTRNPTHHATHASGVDARTHCVCFAGAAFDHHSLLLFSQMCVHRGTKRTNCFTC